MSPTDDDTRDDELLPAGLIADADALPHLAPLMENCGLRLIAQAGMRQSQAQPGVNWYDDTRVMIAQSGIRALLLATSLRAAVQLGRTALEHGVHVWRPPPLGRNFAEAVEVVRAASAGRAVYRVASWWDHVAADVRAAGRSRPDYRPRFSDLRVSARGPSRESWRASLADAGGGVLMSEAYDLLETLVALRQLPETVSAAVGTYRHPPGEPPREAEDTAAAILRYDDGLATVHATWDLPPFEQTSRHHGSHATLALDRERVAICTDEGETLHENRWSDRIEAAELSRFASMIRSAAPAAAAQPAMERHLAVSALLEAMYLSARTGQPETPAKLFEVQGWRVPRL